MSLSSWIWPCSSTQERSGNHLCLNDELLFGYSEELFVPFWTGLISIVSIFKLNKVAFFREFLNED